MVRNRRRGRDRVLCEAVGSVIYIDPFEVNAVMMVAWSIQQGLAVITDQVKRK